jgi:Tol biopolymer transport system component
VAACEDALDLFNVRTGEKIELPDECWGTCVGVEWSPDGKWISFQTMNHFGNTGIYLVGISCMNHPVNCLVDTPMSLISYLLPPAPYAWSPDSKYVVMTAMPTKDWDNTIEMNFIDIQTGRVQRRLEIPDYSGYLFLFLDWSPDGKWILFNQDSQENKFYKVPASGGTPIFITDSPTFIQWINIP